MTIKKFTIFTSIIIGIIIVTSIVLGCVKIDNGLKFDEPQKFKVYAKSSIGLEYSKETTPSKYNELNNLYKEMTNLSIFKYMINGVGLDIEPGQDMAENEDSWLESNKSNYYCLEVIFEDKQSTVVNVNGDTKVVEFYALIMKVEKSVTGKEVALYFSTSEGSSKSYSKNPLLVMAKQNKVFKFIDKVSEKED